MMEVEVGDRVMINETDVEKIATMQRNHGGWNGLMTELLKGPSTVVELTETKATVVATSGEKYVLNRKLLTKYKKEIKPQVGSKVEIIRNQKLFKQLMRYEGEIPKDVKEILGKKVEIVQIFVDGDCGIKYKNKTFIITEKCISNFGVGNTKMSDSPSELVVLDEHIMALYYSICTCNVALVSEIINIIGPNTKIRNRYPLIIATEKGHPIIIKCLLEKKADVNVKDETGDTALHGAVAKNDFEVCSLLVEYGADVNSLNNHKATPIMFATLKGSVDILQLLAQHKEADLTIGNVMDETALHLAVKTSEIECIKILLNIGGCPKTVRNTQYIPLHVAAMQKDEKILKVFLEKFGESIVNLQEDDKHAAIHYAVLKRSIPCLKLLIEYKADINLKNNVLQTPLHLAVIIKSLDCIKILVENKADLDLKDKGGRTPLQVGINLHVTEAMSKFMPYLRDDEQVKAMENLERGPDTLEDIVLYLANAGARLDIKNADGASPIDECMDDNLKKKLLAILDERKKQKVSKVSTSKPIKVAGTKSVAEELKELRQTIKQMRDEETCKMCNERRRSIVFGCGHTACDICANDLAECQVCHYKIGAKIIMIA